MLLRELLAAPALRLRLLIEPPGSLDRELRRVWTTDLLWPSQYLSGGELVISGLVWRRSPGDSEIFVKALHDAGAAALAAGNALLGSVPDDLVDACRRHQLALIEVPTEVSFADVTEHVVGAVNAERGDRLSATLGRQRGLLSAAASGSSLVQLAASVSREIGQPLRVLSTTGRAIVPGSTPLAPTTLDAVTRAFLRAERLLVVAAGSRKTPYSLFIVGGGLEHRLTSWIVVAEGNWTEWPAETVESVRELAAIAALDRVRRDEGLHAVGHLAQEVLDLAESGDNPVQMHLRMRQCGLDATRPVVALVARHGDRDGRPDIARAVLEDVAAGYGQPVVGRDREGTAAALVPAAGGDTASAVTAAIRRLAPGLERDQLSLGISEASPVGGLSGALDQARYARAVAQRRGSGVRVVSAEGLTSSVLMLATVPDAVRRMFTSRVLGPVLEHDKRTDADLLGTLQAFLDCSCSWSRAAELLHLHVNTVRYRIERVEELTGRDLANIEDRVDMFLALRSLSPR